MLCFALNMHTWVFDELDQLDQRQQEVQREKSKPKIKPKKKQNPVVHFRAQPCKNPPAVYFEPKLASVPRIRSLCTSSKVRKKSATPKKEPPPRAKRNSATEKCNRGAISNVSIEPFHFFSIFFLFFTFPIWNRQRKTQVLSGIFRVEPLRGKLQCSTLQI